MSDHHHHRNDNDHGHRHTHGAINASLLTTERGMWAVKWSLIGLLVTALLQVVIVVLSGSVALLADTIHNFGDGLTAVPLWIAFTLARRRPNKQFTYGYGRAEDLAGVAIVLMILLSAGVAGYESINRFFHPHEVSNLWLVAAASIIGFVGNEAVALFRIKVGREINSAALIADGNHARVDGLTSLAVLIGAIGMWLGFSLADPLVGLLITVAILKILWDSARSIFTRMLEGVEPAIVDKIRRTASGVPGVEEVTQVRARWLGHRLQTELHITVDGHLTVEQGHTIAGDVLHQLLHALDTLFLVTVHVDPTGSSGEDNHAIHGHEHDGLPLHSH